MTLRRLTFPTSFATLDFEPSTGRVLAPRRFAEAPRPSSGGDYSPMPLQITFEAESADRGALQVRGLSVVGSEVLVAVQRCADGRYLTLHGQWDEAASWYPCPRLDASDTEARFATGTALAAGIIGAGGIGLRVHLRRRDFSDCGPLEVFDPRPLRPVEPAPSQTPPNVPIPPASRPPARYPPAAVQPNQDRAAPRPPGVQGIDPAAVPRSADRAARPGSDPNPDPERSRSESEPTRSWTAVRWAALALCGIGVGALIWWYSSGDSVRQTPLATQPDSGQGAAPVPAGGPTGKALYLALKGRNLAPADLFEQAERIAQGGDCEAAIRLFVDAAKSDPRLAERLAHWYDPQGFQPAPCVAAPQTDSALVWYLRAAEDGSAPAQRRYGELLLDETSAGPVHRDAIVWLRKAAAAGDRLAADRLAALGER